ncbi:hypothetical protein GFL39_11620 [Rhizobium leguminosarum bv. viciae]|uniref:hypothetical protein n=1 Tax=Rhizobium leguminosarum TaxID=384 RepID=UPI0014424B5F|nr:hypothetical protein [Rhizobium leguminosarum]NKL05595.1 hypothetical protein [Rhizobium leguminosarum bv. viciae]
MLLSHCPVCEMALGWTKTAGVVYCEWCPRRSVDLREFPQQLVQPEDGEAIEFVGDLVNPEVTDIDFSKWKSSALGSLSRGDLFQLVVKTASESQRAESGSYSTAIQFKHLERAGRAVLGWPKSFVTLAETIGPMQGKAGASLRERPLWRLRYDPTLNADVRRQLKAMHRTSRNRSVTTHSYTRVYGRSLRSVSHPHAPLRSPQVELQRLIGGYPFRCVEGDIEAKIKVLRNIHEVQAMSLSLGLPVFDLYELYKEGLLPELQASLTDCGFPEPSHQAEVSAREVMGSIPARGTPGGANVASLRYAMEQQQAVPWSTIFTAISNGKMTLSRGRPSGRGTVHDLYPDDFATVDSVLNDPRNSYLPSSLSLTQSELALSMGKSISMAARFVELTGIANGLTLGRIREERQKWIMSFESRILLQRRGIDPGEMITNLRSASVPFKNHKGIFLWARADAMECLGLQ